MDRLKRPRAVLVFSLLYAVALSGGGFWLLHLKTQAGRDLATLQRQLAERDQLARLSPAPSEPNERAIMAELGAARRALEKLRGELQGREPALLASPPVAQPIDAYFELTGFVEQMRALAGRLQVALRPDERFGFSTHAREGPAAAQLPAVRRQQFVVRHLVETLLEAHPREVRSVQRERPLGAAQRVARPNPPPAGAVGEGGADGPAEVAADFFTPDERRPLRIAGLVETEFFRLEFIGPTQALRAFLNALAAFRLPVVVRRVEVEPVDAAPPGPVASGPAPLVAAPSRFTVVVEFIEVLPSAPLSLP